MKKIINTLIEAFGKFVLVYLIFYMTFAIFLLIYCTTKGYLK